MTPPDRAIIAVERQFRIIFDGRFFLVTTLTTAFVGVAHIHTPDFIKRLNNRQSEIVVKAVYDHQPDRGRKRAAELAGAEYVDSPEAIFGDTQIGSVVICAETSLHKDLVLAAARAGK